jgi:regulator of nucleoside diphosphate kinase
MSKEKNQIVLRKDDYETVMAYLNNGHYASRMDTLNIAELKKELQKAVLVSKDELPPDVVRLNSKVKIKANNQAEIMELTLVTPDKADIKAKKISIIAPVGTALIGFRKGQKVKWQVPSGKKTFTIMEVINDY